MPLEESHRRRIAELDRIANRLPDRPQRLRAVTLDMHGSTQIIGHVLIEFVGCFRFVAHERVRDGRRERRVVAEREADGLGGAVAFR